MSRIVTSRMVISGILLLTLSGCKSEQRSDEISLSDTAAEQPASPLDSVVRNVTVPVIDSGSILVSRPDSTDSIRAAGPLVALNDTTKPAAVPMPNAWQDSAQVLRLDSLDSMLVREIEKTRKR